MKKTILEVKEIIYEIGAREVCDGKEEAKIISY